MTAGEAVAAVRMSATETPDAIVVRWDEDRSAPG